MSEVGDQTVESTILPTQALARVRCAASIRLKLGLELITSSIAATVQLNRHDAMSIPLVCLDYVSLGLLDIQQIWYSTTH